MIAEHLGWTDSHTLLIAPPTDRTARDWTVVLEQANIITSAVPLSRELGGEGIRIGTQEITRRGAEAHDMDTVAKAIADVFQGGDMAKIKRDVEEFSLEFDALRYSVDQQTFGDPIRA